MAGSANPTPDQYETNVAQAVEYLRGNVKWTLIAFGAIGTTLLAGSQLSNIGRFEANEPRLWVGLVCALAALLAAAYAVNSAMKVAYAGYTEFFDLGEPQRNFVQRNPALLEGFDTVVAVALAHQKSAALRHQELVADQPDPQNLTDNEIWFGYLNKLISKVVAYVRYDAIKQEAERSRRELKYASIVAGAALVGFGWAANPKTEQPIVLLKSPTSEASLTLTADGKAALAPLLGASCAALSQIKVIVLSVGAAESDVISLKTKDCALARFTVKDTLGKLSASSP